MTVNSRINFFVIVFFTCACKYPKPAIKTDDINKARKNDSAGTKEVAIETENTKNPTKLELSSTSPLFIKGISGSMF